MLSTHPVIRISLILIYFTLCQACGAPDNAPEQAAQSNVATDVNYIGGGTQAPYETQEPEYNSPMIPDDHVPTALAWAGSIRQAISLAGSDRKYRIIVWFENQNCAECNQVRTDVFNDPDVIAETRYWLFVKVDTDKEEDTTQYMLGNADPPAMIFLDNNGNQYREYNGVVTKEEFITMLKTWR